MELVDVTFVYTSEMFLKMANCIFFASVQSKSPLEPNRGLGASLSWEKVLRFFNFIWAPFGPILFERWFSQRGRWCVIEEPPSLVQHKTAQDAERKVKIDPWHGWCALEAKTLHVSSPKPLNSMISWLIADYQGKLGEIWFRAKHRDRMGASLLLCPPWQADPWWGGDNNNQQVDNHHD